MVITFDAIWCLKHRGQFAKANRTFGICRKNETCVSVVTNFGMDRTEKIRVCRRLIKKYEYKEDGLIPLGPHVLFAFSIYLLRQQQPFESLRSYCRIWGRNHFPFNTLFPPAAFGSDRLDNNNQTLIVEENAMSFPQRIPCFWYFGTHEFWYKNEQRKWFSSFSTYQRV